jgi:hypothetical protein
MGTLARFIFKKGYKYEIPVPDTFSVSEGNYMVIPDPGDDMKKKIIEIKKAEKEENCSGDYSTIFSIHIEPVVNKDIDKTKKHTSDSKPTSKRTALKRGFNSRAKYR